ncbi:MAG: hypothetical protein OSJ43_11480 [Oscillospiraceae bacterium]|nr:hypothetical protein [Oscillospiraceae bacterium]
MERKAKSLNLNQIGLKNLRKFYALAGSMIIYQRVIIFMAEAGEEMN